MLLGTLLLPELNFFFNLQSYNYKIYSKIAPHKNLPLWLSGLMLSLSHSAVSLAG